MESAGDIVADIERRIADGVLRPGDRVPPVRVLAEQVGLAPNTVAAAYRTLGHRGILIGRGRAGTFVAGRPPLAMPSGPVVPAGVTDLATGNPDAALLPDPARYFPEPGTRPVLYGERALEPDLEARGRETLGSDGIEARGLVAVSGALDGIERVLGAHLRPGDRIAVEDPAYASVHDLVGALGLTPVPIPVDDEGLVAAEAESVLSDGVAALIVTPRAHNPTGAATSAARAERLRAALKRAPDVLVIEDDHAGRVAGAPINSIIDPGRERWAFVRSVAKGYGPDLRLAMVAGAAPPCGASKVVSSSGPVG